MWFWTNIKTISYTPNRYGCQSDHGDHKNIEREHTSELSRKVAVEDEGEYIVHESITIRKHTS